MKPKLLLLTLLLALTLAACAPARSEPESGSEASAPSLPGGGTALCSRLRPDRRAALNPLPRRRVPPRRASSPGPSRTGPMSSFYTAVVDWAGGTRTADSLVERYGDLIVSDRYFRLANEDGSLSGWIELGRDGTVPETVPVEELYQNSAGWNSSRANCKAGKPDQLVWLSRGDPLLYGLQVYTFDGETLWREFLMPERSDLLTSADLSESELVEGDGWWQINTVDGVRGILVPEEALTRSVLDLEEVLQPRRKPAIPLCRSRQTAAAFPAPIISSGTVKRPVCITAFMRRRTAAAGSTATRSTAASGWR